VRRFALAFLLLAACSEETDDAGALPFAEAEHARGLPFLRKPSVVKRTRTGYADEAAAAITDEEVAIYRTVWGRLGFIPTDFDLRAATKANALRYGAVYEEKNGGQITKFDEDDQPAYMVHELVHALQDQHFDLAAHDEAATSVDELLSARALVEGDARLAETRYRIESWHGDPLVEAPKLVTSAHAREESQELLAFEGVPAFISGFASFSYSYGSVVVAKAVGLHDQPARWDTAGADALFRGGAPRSSEAILRTSLGIEVDPIVDVGLERLPLPLAETYEMRVVERIGAWFTWILLREAGETRFEIAMDWDGDQLVVIGSKDPKEPPSAVVWTSAWENEVVASQVADDLRRLHAAAAEPLVVDRRGVEVVFAKGTLPEADIQLVANAALYERTSGPRPAASRKTIDLERFFDVHSTQIALSSTRMRHGVVPFSR
jgi:hypothetical protein